MGRDSPMINLVTFRGDGPEIEAVKYFGSEHGHCTSREADSSKSSRP